MKLFGSLRDRAGRRELELDLPPAATVADALCAAGLEDRVDVWALVDGNRAGRETPLGDGAEVQFFQPVGGG